jgi:hypothetical protein
MPRLLLILVLIAAHTQAQQPSTQSKSQAPDASQLLNVGDIPFDPALDDPNFHLNDSSRVFQYYNSNSWWLDHKDAYRNLFIKAACELPPIPAVQARTQSGWLTIRFIVNPAGETGRFRKFEMDSVYRPIEFDPRLTACLLATIKTAHWEPAHYRGKTYDTYQYVTFHLVQGRIVDIMP